MTAIDQSHAWEKTILKKSTLFIIIVSNDAIHLDTIPGLLLTNINESQSQTSETSASTAHVTRTAGVRKPLLILLTIISDTLLCFPLSNLNMLFFL